ncbi:hypothetical protein HK105_204563 [Polyrhizophydium stewartii]|uniref:Protein kinase domain-containing protein n=1 Tax=Polyrhizophydium stewartii TaxID=2732419 RepID=A0ABR4N8K7_9FUNG
MSPPSLLATPPSSRPSLHSTPAAQQPARGSLANRHLAGKTLSPAFSAKYAIQHELGSGGFGFVCSARRIVDGLDVAVKFIIRERMTHAAWVIDRDLGRVPLEVYILKNVKHENIVSFVDYLEDAHFCYLITELHGAAWTPEADASHLPSPVSPRMSPADAFATAAAAATTTPPPLVSRPSMDLFECIERYEHFSEEQARYVFRQIISAAAYLQANGLVHRDIKDENILIDDAFHVKVIDFGSASYFDPPGGRKFDRFMGTIQYAPPEILLKHRYRGPEAETWALGCCLYIMLTGQVPFGSAQQAMYQPFSRPSVPISPSCMDLLSRMLVKDPSKRATMGDIVSHPWLQAA